MKVKGVRLYGVKDIRLEEFEIPEIAEDEILLKIECNGIAVSTLKEITLAQRHLRVPKNIKKNPVLIGHEFSGTIAKVGTRWKEDYQEGKHFVISTRDSSPDRITRIFLPLFWRCSNILYHTSRCN